MIERLSTLGRRGKLYLLSALIVMLPAAVWLGYNLGHWMATR